MDFIHGSPLLFDLFRLLAPSPLLDLTLGPTASDNTVARAMQACHCSLKVTS